jgi:hypothetical protein
MGKTTKRSTRRSAKRSTKRSTRRSAKTKRMVGKGGWIPGFRSDRTFCCDSKKSDLNVVGGINIGENCRYSSSSQCNIGYGTGQKL